MTWDFGELEEFQGGAKSKPSPPKGKPKRNWTVCAKCGEHYTESTREHIKKCRPPKYIAIGSRVMYKGKEYVVIDIGDFPDTHNIIDKELDYQKNVDTSDLRIQRERKELPDEAPF